MALDGNSLGSAIASAVGGLTEEQKKDQDTIWKTVALEIITHIKANAQITVTVSPGIPVTTAGSAATQTGATTAPGSGQGTIA